MGTTILDDALIEGLLHLYNKHCREIAAIDQVAHFRVHAFACCAAMIKAGGTLTKEQFVADAAMAWDQTPADYFTVKPEG